MCNSGRGAATPGQTVVLNKGQQRRPFNTDVPPTSAPKYGYRAQYTAAKQRTVKWSCTGLGLLQSLHRLAPGGGTWRCRAS